MPESAHYEIAAIARKHGWTVDDTSYDLYRRPRLGMTRGDVAVVAHFTKTGRMALAASSAWTSIPRTRKREAVLAELRRA